MAGNLGLVDCSFGEHDVEEVIDGGLNTFANIELGYIMASAVQLLFYNIDLSEGDQIVPETLRVLLDLMQGHF